MKKTIFFLMVSLIFMGFLLGDGKEAQGAYTVDEDCYWFHACDVKWCRSGYPNLCADCGGGDCQRSGCGGPAGYYSDVYQNSCTGSQYCANMPLPPVGRRSTCYYISYWYCSGATPIAVWGSTSGSSCSDAGQISCCAPGYGNTCYSGYNDCNHRNSGSIQCNGSCSATTPANEANCNDSGNYCNGTSYTGNCGQNCTGTKNCAPTLSLTAPSPVDYNANINLSWNVQDATGCWGEPWGDPLLTPIGNGGKNNANGTHTESTGNLTATTTYKMNCWNNNPSPNTAESTAAICVRNCNLDSDSHCEGTTYTGNCGQSCNGTLPNSCGGWGTCSKECGGGVQTKNCVCPTRTESRACASQPCPPSYKEVAPW